MAFPDDIPIAGPIRLPMLMIRTCVYVVSFSLAVVYWKKYWTQRRSFKETRLYLAWCILLAGFGFMTFFYLLGDFYTSDPNTRAIVVQLGYISAASGAFSFTYHVEHFLPASRKEIFSKIMEILFTALIVMFLLALVFPALNSFIQYYAASFWVPTSGIIVLYSLNIIRRTRGRFRVLALHMFIGYLVMMISVLGSTDFMARLTEDWFHLLSETLQLVGLLMVGVFSTQLPSWGELEWQENLKHVFILYKGGVPIFSYDVGQPDQSLEGKIELTIDDDDQKTLIDAGTLEASKVLLDVVLQKGELKKIEFKERILYYSQGEYITTVLVATRSLKSLEIIANLITDEFERFFYPILLEWHSDTRVFSPARAIIEIVLGFRRRNN